MGWLDNLDKAQNSARLLNKGKKLFRLAERNVMPVLKRAIPDDLYSKEPAKPAPKKPEARKQLPAPVKRPTKPVDDASYYEKREIKPMPKRGEAPKPTATKPAVPKPSDSTLKTSDTKHLVNKPEDPRVYKDVGDLPAYYGPGEVKTCKGWGCAKLATAETANLYGLKYNQLPTADAWYKKAEATRSGGREIWSASSGKPYSGLKVGDFVSLDRPTDPHKYDKAKGFTLAENENIEHTGIIVGMDPKTGEPLVRHGSESGKTYVQPISKLKLLDVGYEYKPKSIYRAKATEDLPFKPGKNYQKRTPAKPLSFTEGAQPTGNKEKYLKAINENMDKQQLAYDLDDKEVNLVNRVSYGIFNNESKAGETLKPIGGKMIGADILHRVGVKSDSPSLGDVQFKYKDIKYNADGTLSKTGKLLEAMDVNEAGMADPLKHREDYTDEVNAVAAELTTAMKKFKNDPKFKYDTDKQTVYGDIPLSVAMAARYRFGPRANKEKFLREHLDYGRAAGKKAVEELGGPAYKALTPEGQKMKLDREAMAAQIEEAKKTGYQKAIGLIPQGFKKNGGSMNPNDFRMEGMPGYVGEGISTKGRKYSPAWGGQFKAGGKLPTGGLKRSEDYGSKSKPYPSVSKGDFAGGGRSYPIPTKADAGDALRLASLHGRPDVKAKVYAKYPELKKSTNGGWLDKYESGGSLPGTVGFTYARTKGIPSNGKYAKKTMASAKSGRVIKDDRGQWAYPGEITEIGSNNITMQGVPYDVMGISDTGDMKLMKPGRNYKYKGNKVIEYPIGKNGKELQKLDQLTNFTNYNTKQPGGWLDKL